MFRTGGGAYGSAAISGGTIDGTVIGGTTAAAITGTTITATTKFLAPDGSTTTPTHSFTNATNMGLSNLGSNQLGLLTAGAPAAIFSLPSLALSQWGASSTYTMNLAGSGAVSDRAGMNFLFGSGQGAGLGTIGYFAFQQTPAALATSSTVNPYVTTKVVHNVKSITNNTGTAMVNFTLASNTVVAGQVKYAVEVFNGTDLQVEEGIATFHAINKAGVFSGNTVVKFGNQQAVTSGTLVVTWTITGANPAVLTLNANSSLTPSTGYPRITYSLENLTQQAIALQ